MCRLKLRWCSILVFLLIAGCKKENGIMITNSTNLIAEDNAEFYLVWRRYGGTPLLWNDYMELCADGNVTFRTQRVFAPEAGSEIGLYATRLDIQYVRSVVDAIRSLRPEDGVSEGVEPGRRIGEIYWDPDKTFEGDELLLYYLLDVPPPISMGRLEKAVLALEFLKNELLQHPKAVLSLKLEVTDMEEDKVLIKLHLENRGKEPVTLYCNRDKLPEESTFFIRFAPEGTQPGSLLWRCVPIRVTEPTLKVPPGGCTLTDVIRIEGVKGTFIFQAFYEYYPSAPSKDETILIGSTASQPVSLKLR